VRAWDVPEETVAHLLGLEIPVILVHRGRGKGRRTVICTDLELGRQRILRHLKRRWGIEVMFRMLREHFVFSHGLRVGWSDPLGPATAGRGAESGEKCSPEPAFLPLIEQPP